MDTFSQFQDDLAVDTFCVQMLLRLSELAGNLALRAGATEFIGTRRKSGIAFWCDLVRGHPLRSGVTEFIGTRRKFGSAIWWDLVYQNSQES